VENISDSNIELNNTLYLTYIVDNKIISIDPAIDPDETMLNLCLLLEKYKSKFKKSFKEEKHIWEDYRYIHNLKIEDISDECFDKIEKGFKSHFDYIYKDAKKVYERRMESFD